MDKTLIAILIALLVGCADGNSFDALRAVPIDNEPNHHLVLNTDAFRVFDVTIPPGVQSKWHTHSHDSVLITLDGADVPSETPGVPVAKRPPIASGYIYYRPYGVEKFTHRITNVDQKAFRILDIELLKPIVGVKLSDLGPRWTKVLDNDQVRVSKVNLVAGEALENSFPGEHLFVTMTDANFSVGDLNLKVKRGSMIPDSKVATKFIQNIGDVPLELVVIEVK